MKKRQKISYVLTLTSVLLSLIVYFISEEQILTGYSVVNGVESITYMPKLKGTIMMITIPIALAFLWNAVANWNDKKIASNPMSTSLRFRGGMINLYFGILSFVAHIMGIMNIVLWLQRLV